VLREAFHLRLSAQKSSAAAAQDPGAWYALEDWRYAYDAQHRLIGTQQDAEDPLWLAWQANGALAAMMRSVHHADPTNTTGSTDAADATDPTGAVGAARTSARPKFRITFSFSLFLFSPVVGLTLSRFKSITHS